MGECDSGQHHAPLVNIMEETHGLQGIAEHNNLLDEGKYMKTPINNQIQVNGVEANDQRGSEKNSRRSLSKGESLKVDTNTGCARTAKKSLSKEDSGQGASLKVDIDDTLLAHGQEGRAQKSSQRSLKKTDSDNVFDSSDDTETKIQVNGVAANDQSGSEKKFSLSKEDSGKGESLKVDTNTGCARTTKKSLSKGDSGHGDIDEMLLVHGVEGRARRNSERSLKKDDSGNTDGFPSVIPEVQSSLEGSGGVPSEGQRDSEVSDKEGGGQHSQRPQSKIPDCPLNQSHRNPKQIPNQACQPQLVKQPEVDITELPQQVQHSKSNHDCVFLKNPAVSENPQGNKRVKVNVTGSHLLTVPSRPSCANPTAAESYSENPMSTDSQASEYFPKDSPSLNPQSIFHDVMPAAKEIPRASHVSRNVLLQMEDELTKARQLNHSLIQKDAANENRIKVLTELIEKVIVAQDHERQSMSEHCQKSNQSMKALAEHCRIKDTYIKRLEEEEVQWMAEKQRWRQCVEAEKHMAEQLKRRIEELVGENESWKKKHQSLWDNIKILQQEKLKMHQSLWDNIKILQQEKLKMSEQHQRRIRELQEEIRKSEFKREVQEHYQTRSQYLSLAQNITVRRPSGRQATDEGNLPSQQSPNRSIPEDLPSHEGDDTEVKTVHHGRRLLTSQRAITSIDNADDEGNDDVQPKHQYPVLEEIYFEEEVDAPSAMEDETEPKTPIEMRETLSALADCQGVTSDAHTAIVEDWQNNEPNVARLRLSATGPNDNQSSVENEMDEGMIALGPDGLSRSFPGIHPVENSHVEDEDIQEF